MNPQNLQKSLAKASEQNKTEAGSKKTVRYYRKNPHGLNKGELTKHWEREHWNYRLG